MPLLKTIDDSVNQIYIWKIEETLEELLADIKLNETSQERLNGMKSISHQRGFLAVRKILQEIQFTDDHLFYDKNGKPHLTTGQNISISHAFDFSVIMLSKKNCGVDIEKQKEKILKIGPRFCDESHLNDTKTDKFIKLRKYTIAWGIKESIFKIKNKPGISFPEHITVNPFNLDDDVIKVSLFFEDKIEDFEAKYEEIEGYTLVWIND